MSEVRNQYYRLIDANFNRAKEGLRVCEDVCRFILNRKKETAQYRKIRHALTESLKSFKIKNIVEARNVLKDVGRKAKEGEIKRNKAADVYFANAQRVKESIRVLEEFAKLVNVTQAQKLKTLRYQCYELERTIVKQL